MMMLIIIGVHKLIFLVGTPIVSSWGRLLSETEYQYKGYVACWINNILGEDVVQKLGLETAIIYIEI